jgi:hydrogenase nickel incorporation protein HypA/HybF
VHELSIAQAVVGTVTDAVPGCRVERVRLHVGMLAGVVPEALSFCWEIATQATPLEGSVLEIERVPLDGTCLDCGTASTYVATPPLTCPRCGGPALPTSDGRTLEVSTVDIVDENSTVDIVDDPARGDSP